MESLRLLFSLLYSFHHFAVLVKSENIKVLAIPLCSGLLTELAVFIKGLSLLSEVTLPCLDVAVCSWPPALHPQPFLPVTTCGCFILFNRSLLTSLPVLISFAGTQGEIISRVDGVAVILADLLWRSTIGALFVCGWKSWFWHPFGLQLMRWLHTASEMALPLDTQWVITQHLQLFFEGSTESWWQMVFSIP